jgi:hypothetical protein
MVDPRIYRAVWVIVFVALIVFGFSLQSRPAAARTDLAPGVSFGSAAASAETMAGDFGTVTPGSPADAQMAGYIAGQLRKAGGFSVSTRSAVTRTPSGERAIETVEAERPGLSQGTVVVIANRDAATPAAGQGRATVAGTAASAVLLGLAREMSGSTLNRSLLLISTSGSVGATGTAQLVQSLVGKGTDAVIVLGDLAGARVHRPVVVPWSGTNLLAPPKLTSTLGGYLTAQTGLSSADPSLASEFAQLALPFATGSQAPFARLGIPAVGLSLSGDRIPNAAEPVDAARIPRLGLAVDQAVAALDSGPAVPAPSAYLSISSELVPLWAVRLVVLALLLPVAFTLIDALARARRRGHSILSWTVWTLSGIAPFIVGLIVLKLAGDAHVLSAPPAAASGVDFHIAGAGVIVLALLATAIAFRLLRPLGVQVASGIGWRRTPTSPLIEGAVVAMSIVMCGLTTVVWVFNPFAAALLVPALHLWLWLGSPAIAVSRLRALVLLLGGLILPALVAVYYMLALGLTPWALAWSLTLALSGGAVGVGTGLSWCAALGVLAGAIVLLRRASGAASAPADVEVTVRGPLGYAGPGSLGGTQSALRR